MKVEDRARILKAVATGRTWLDELLSGEIASTEALAARERCSERSIRMTLSLAFLSPGIVEAIMIRRGKLGRGYIHRRPGPKVVEPSRLNARTTPAGPPAARL